MSRIRQWLVSLDLGQYADAFETGDIDWASLPQLDHDVLKDLGVRSPGHRLRILRSIEGLEAERATSSGEQPGKVRLATAGTLLDADRRRLTQI